MKLFKFITLTTVIMLCGCGSLPGTRSIGYASWNIGHYAWGKDWKTHVSPEEADARSTEYKAFICETGADILGVCEYFDKFTTDGKREANIDVFGDYKYHEIGKRESWQWNAYFFNGLKVKERKVEYYPMHTQDVYYLALCVELGGEDVWFVQTHLDWSAETIRATQLQKLVDDFKDSPRVVISGDFNIGHREKGKYSPTPEEYGIFLANGYVLANDGLVMTAPSNHPYAPLDNIIVKGLRIDNVRFHNAGKLSDHNAISCRLYY